MSEPLSSRLRSRVTSWLAKLRGSTLARAALVTGVLTILCKGIGFAKELVIASQFGVGPTLDSYLVAIVIPTMVCNVFAISFASALVMQYIKNKTHAGEAVARQRYAISMFWGQGFVVSVAVTGALLGPVLLPWMSPGFRPELQASTQRLLWHFLPYSILAGTSAIWSSILNARGRFVASALSPGVISLGLIFGVLSWPLTDARVLVGGMTVGAFLDVVILGYCIRQEGLPLIPTISRWQPEDRWIVVQTLPMIVATALRSGSLMIDQSMASMLGEGSVSELNYGSRFVAMTQGLVALPLGKILFPHFVQLVESQKWRDVQSLLRRSVLVLLFISIPITIVLAAFSGPLVQWTFRRGQFTSDVATRVAAIQVMYALQFPFFLWSALLSRVAFAMQLRRVVVGGGVLILTINIVMNYVLMRTMGVRGIALSTAIVCLGSACYFSAVIGWSLRRNIRNQKMAVDAAQSEPRIVSRQAA
jgi:putative peptidoglycan lipid II flippase